MAKAPSVSSLLKGAKGKQGSQRGKEDVTTPNADRPGANKGRFGPQTPGAPDVGRGKVYDSEPRPAPMPGPNTRGNPGPYDYRGGPPSLSELADMVEAQRKPRKTSAGPAPKGPPPITSVKSPGSPSIKKGPRTRIPGGIKGPTIPRI